MTAASSGSLFSISASPCWKMCSILAVRNPWTYLEPAQDGRHPLLQVVPALVGAVGHLPQAAGGVGAVLPGQAAILLIDQLQLGQALVDLPLEGLKEAQSGFKGVLVSSSALPHQHDAFAITSNFFSSSLATVYSTPEELGRAAVFSEASSHSWNREKSSRNFCHKRHEAQMLLQRRSRLRVACWMESHSASVAQASQSCSSTSHRFRTDATPVLCFSMSRWSS
ncbi:hypothetical protein EYF80_036474 [Liparis tanakae]|uniref:Uncharacterized protein n=1 Tax=Liparis tanakae TaxID=230148 RepID=A0A4Z2GJ68_9TELE|nr:hypothetical protein EYF80_036474 [Liparis tanakae]